MKTFNKRLFSLFILKGNNVIYDGVPFPLKQELSSFLNFIGSPVKFDEIYLPKKFIELRFGR